MPSEEVVPGFGYKAHRASETGGSYRFVGTFPAWTYPEPATRHDVSHLGENIGLDGHVGVGASYYNYLTHNL